MSSAVMDKPARQRHDWPALLAEFDANVARDNNYLLKTFSNEKKLDYSMIVREFNEIRSQRAVTFMERAKSKLIRSAEPIVNRLITISTESEDENVASRTGLGLLDRMGISPQVAQVQVTTQIQNNVVVAPLFAESHRKDMGEVFDVMPEDEDGKA